MIVFKGTRKTQTNSRALCFPIAKHNLPDHTNQLKSVVSRNCKGWSKSYVIFIIIIITISILIIGAWKNLMVARWKPFWGVRKEV